MYIFRFVTCHQRGEQLTQFLIPAGLKAPSRRLWWRNGSRDEQTQTLLGAVPGVFQSAPSGSVV